MAFDQNKPAANAPLVSVDVRNNFAHIKGAISKEHGWDDTNPASSSHRLDQINVVLTGSQQANWTGSPAVNAGAGASGTVLTQVSGVTAGTYNLQNILQQLVNRSHAHGSQTFNCNCNCNCDGGA